MGEACIVFALHHAALDVVNMGEDGGEERLELLYKLEREWSIELGFSLLPVAYARRGMNDAGVEDEEVDAVLLDYGQPPINDPVEWTAAANQLIAWCEAEGYSMPDSYRVSEEW